MSKNTYNGIINIFKEKGFTSHDVVAKLRGILKQKKVGHTGTLDPDAVGVLPVLLGNATVLSDMLTDKTKEYEAVLLLGRTTDTQDTSGSTIEEKDVGHLDADMVEAAVYSFAGEYMQLPPMYSALKVGGKKLVDLAREGREIERTARRVIVYSIEILGMELPRVVFRAKVSKGTYIRTLCHDIGEKLLVGGCMESLVRNRVDRFDIGESITLTQIEEGAVSEHIMSVEEYFSFLPQIKTSLHFDKYLSNGNKLRIEDADIDTEADMYRMYNSEDDFLAIYKRDGNRLVPFKMFL